MSSADKYDQDTGDDLLEHYADVIVQDGRAPSMPIARLMVDMSGENAMLGRLTEEDEKHGYNARYVLLRARKLAGLITEDEQAEWDQLVEDTAAGDVYVVDGQGEPERVTEADIGQLKEYVQELRRIAAATAGLERDRRRINDQAVPLMRRVGSLPFLDPTDGEAKLANVREPATLQIDAGELLAALIEHFQGGLTDEHSRVVAEEEAETVWRACLKGPQVDTKDGGLFHQMCQAEKVPVEVIAKVARYKTSSPYIGYAKSGG